MCSVGASECIQPCTEEQFVDVPVPLQGILTVEVVEQIQVAGGEDSPCSSSGASVALSMGLGVRKCLFQTIRTFLRVETRWSAPPRFGR